MASVRRLAVVALALIGTLVAAGGTDAPGSTRAQAAWPAIELDLVVSGFQSPVRVVTMPDTGRILVVERSGRIEFVKYNNSIRPQPFMDIDSRVINGGSEQGLLGLAFPPDFATSRVFYVYYIRPSSGAGTSVVARYAMSTSNLVQGNASSEQVLWTLRRPYTNHNGGQIEFGPDGQLWIANGDGGSAGDPENRAQNNDSKFGKILRVPVTKAMSATTFRNSLAWWGKGLRNPWTFSFDRLNGDVYIADVGQGLREEVNRVPGGTGPGLNFGWDIMEGSVCFPDPAASCNSAGMTLPVAEYSHDADDIPGEPTGCSVTGGSVYRGNSSSPLYGMYFFGDYCTGQIWGLRPDGSGGWEQQALLDTNLKISDFGVDANGSILVLDLNGGLYRLRLAD